VDSALLRFISSQKKQQQQPLQDGSNSSCGVQQTDLTIFVDSLEPTGDERTTESTLATTESATNAATMSRSGAEEEQIQRVNGESNVDPPKLEERQDPTVAAADGTHPITNQDYLDPWLGQFNRNRVAQKLVSIGAEEAEAHVAGTARRKIREFLRERDSLWNAPNTSNGNNNDGGEALQSRLQQKMKTKKEPTHPGYGFDDVVELLMDYGLTGRDICAILTHSPSVAVMKPRRDKGDPRSDDDDDSGKSGGDTLEETLNRAFSGLLCTTLQLRRYDARKVLRSTPGLLSKRGSKAAMQVVAMLSQTGVSTSSMARDKTALPTFLSRSPAGLFRLISFLSSDAIRMPIKQIGPLIRRSESLELLNAVVPAPKLILDNSSTSTDEDDITDPEVEEALLGKASELREQKIVETYKKMAATAWTLRNEIGTKDLGLIVSAYPSVLLLDAKEQILPVASYLMEELGICDGDLVSVLQLYPVLLGKTVEELQEVEAFLLWLEVEPDNLASIFRSFPNLLMLDVKKDMLPVVEFLQSIGISNIGRFISRLPPVLGYSVENELRPKWNYLNSVSMYANFELSKFPAYFSYPFERVIKTRYEYLSSKQSPTDIIPIDTILRFGDKDFATKVARDDDSGQNFRAFADGRKTSKALPKHRKKQQPSAKRNAENT
jgi:mTERF